MLIALDRWENMALTPEQLTALPPEELARLARDATLVDAPALTYASSLQVAQAGNDAVISFARPRPALMSSGEPAPFMKSEITAIIYVSIQTLKDFSLALADQIGRYEAEHGEIETEYSRTLAKK